MKFEDLTPEIREVIGKYFSVRRDPSGEVLVYRGQAPENPAPLGMGDSNLAFHGSERGAVEFCLMESMP